MLGRMIALRVMQQLSQHMKALPTTHLCRYTVTKSNSFVPIATTTVMMMLKVGVFAHLPGRPPVATLPGLDVIVRHLLQLVLEATSFRQQRQDVIIVASVRRHVIAQLRYVSHPARHGIRRNETRRELSFFVLGGPCHKRGFLGHLEVSAAIPNSIRGVTSPP